MKTKPFLLSTLIVASTALVAATALATTEKTIEASVTTGDYTVEDLVFRSETETNITFGGDASATVSNTTTITQGMNVTISSSSGTLSFGSVLLNPSDGSSLTVESADVVFEALSLTGLGGASASSGTVSIGENASLSITNDATLFTVDIAGTLSVGGNATISNVTIGETAKVTVEGDFGANNLNLEGGSLEVNGAFNVDNIASDDDVPATTITVNGTMTFNRDTDANLNLDVKSGGALIFKENTYTNLGTGTIKLAEDSSAGAADAAYAILESGAEVFTAGLITDSSEVVHLYDAWFEVTKDGVSQKLDAICTLSTGTVSVSGTDSTAYFSTTTTFGELDILVENGTFEVKDNTAITTEGKLAAKNLTIGSGKAKLTANALELGEDGTLTMNGGTLDLSKTTGETNIYAVAKNSTGTITEGALNTGTIVFNKSVDAKDLEVTTTKGGIKLVGTEDSPITVTIGDTSAKTATVGANTLNVDDGTFYNLDIADGKVYGRTSLKIYNFVGDNAAGTVDGASIVYMNFDGDMDSTGTLTLGSTDTTTITVDGDLTLGEKSAVTAGSFTVGSFSASTFDLSATGTTFKVNNVTVGADSMLKLSGTQTVGSENVAGTITLNAGDSTATPATVAGTLTTTGSLTATGQVTLNGGTISASGTDSVLHFGNVTLADTAKSGNVAAGTITSDTLIIDETITDFVNDKLFVNELSIGHLSDSETDNVILESKANADSTGTALRALTFTGKGTTSSFTNADSEINTTKLALVGGEISSEKVTVTIGTAGNNEILNEESLEVVDVGGRASLVTYTKDDLTSLKYVGFGESTWTHNLSSIEITADEGNALFLGAFAQLNVVDGSLTVNGNVLLSGGLSGNEGTISAKTGIDITGNVKAYGYSKFESSEGNITIDGNVEFDKYATITATEGDIKIIASEDADGNAVAGTVVFGDTATLTAGGNVKIEANSALNDADEVEGGTIAFGSTATIEAKEGNVEITANPTTVTDDEGNTKVSAGTIEFGSVAITAATDTTATPVSTDNGNVTITATSTTVKNAATITGTNNVTVKGDLSVDGKATISSALANVLIDATAGTNNVVSVGDNSAIKATAGTVTIKGNTTARAGTEISAKDDVEISAVKVAEDEDDNSTVSFLGAATVKSDTGDVTITASNGTSNSISAVGAATITATAGNVTLTAGTYDDVDNPTEFTAGTLSFGAGTEITAPAGTVTINGNTTLASTSANASSITARGNVALNGDLSAGDSVTVSSTTGSVSIDTKGTDKLTLSGTEGTVEFGDDAVVKATASKQTVTITGDLTVGENATINANGNVTITGRVTQTEGKNTSSIFSTNANVAIDALDEDDSFSLNTNATISAKSGAVKIGDTTAYDSITFGDNATITTGTAVQTYDSQVNTWSFTNTADNDITLSAGTIKIGDNAKVTAKGDTSDVSITGTTISIRDNATITAGYSISSKVDDTKYTSKNSDVAISADTIEIGANSTIASLGLKGTVSITGSTTIDSGATISADGNITVAGTAKKDQFVLGNNSTIVSENGAISITADTVRLGTPKRDDDGNPIAVIETKNATKGDITLANVHGLYNGVMSQAKVVSAKDVIFQGNSAEASLTVDAAGQIIIGEKATLKNYNAVLTANKVNGVAYVIREDGTLNLIGNSLTTDAGTGLPTAAVHDLQVTSIAKGGTLKIGEVTYNEDKTLKTATQTLAKADEIQSAGTIEVEQNSTITIAKLTESTGSRLLIAGTVELTQDDAKLTSAIVADNLKTGAMGYLKTADKTLELAGGTGTTTTDDGTVVPETVAGLTITSNKTEQNQETGKYDRVALESVTFSGDTAFVVNGELVLEAEKTILAGTLEFTGTSATADLKNVEVTTGSLKVMDGAREVTVTNLDLTSGGEGAVFVESSLVDDDGVAVISNLSITDLTIADTAGLIQISNYGNVVFESMTSGTLSFSDWNGTGNVWLSDTGTAEVKFDLTLTESSRGQFVVAEGNGVTFGHDTTLSKGDEGYNQYAISGVEADSITLTEGQDLTIETVEDGIGVTIRKNTDLTGATLTVVETQGTEETPLSAGTLAAVTMTDSTLNVEGQGSLASALEADSITVYGDSTISVTDATLAVAGTLAVDNNSSLALKQTSAALAVAEAISIGDKVTLSAKLKDSSIAVGTIDDVTDEFVAGNITIGDGANVTSASLTNSTITAGTLAIGDEATIGELKVAGTEVSAASITVGNLAKDGTAATVMMSDSKVTVGTTDANDEFVGGAITIGDNMNVASAELTDSTITAGDVTIGDNMTIEELTVAGTEVSAASIAVGDDAVVGTVELTALTITATNSIAIGEDATIDSVTLTDSTIEVTADDGVLSIGAGSTIEELTATGTTISATNVELGDEVSVTGTLTESTIDADSLMIGDGATIDLTLSTTDGSTSLAADETTIGSGADVSLKLSNTTVDAGTLTIAAGTEDDVSSLSVTGTDNAVTSIFQTNGITLNEYTALTLSNLNVTGEIELASNSTLVLDGVDYNSGIEIGDTLTGTSVTIANSTIDGNVSLAGAENSLRLDSATIRGDLSAAAGTLTIAGDNLVSGTVIIDHLAVELIQEGGATLTANSLLVQGETGKLQIDGKISVNATMLFDGATLIETEDGVLSDVWVYESTFTQNGGTAGKIVAIDSNLKLAGTVGDVMAHGSSVTEIANAEGYVFLKNGGDTVTAIDLVAGTLTLDNAKASVSTKVGGDTTLTNDAELTVAGTIEGTLNVKTGSTAEVSGTVEGTAVVVGGSTLISTGTLANVWVLDSTFEQTAGTAGDVTAYNSDLTLAGTVNNVSAVDSDVHTIADAQGNVFVKNGGDTLTAIDSVAGTLALDNASATVSTLVGGNTTLTNGASLMQLGGTMADVDADDSELFQIDGELGNVTVKNDSVFTQLAGTAGDVEATNSTITLMGMVENVTTTDSDVVAIADAQGDVSITNSLTGDYVTNIDSVAGTLKLSNAKATVSTKVGGETDLTKASELTQLGGEMADVWVYDSTFTQEAGTAGDVFADDSTLTLSGTVNNVTALESDIYEIANAEGNVEIVDSMTGVETAIDSVAGTLSLDNASATVSTLVGGDTTLTNGAGLTQLGGTMANIDATDSKFMQLTGTAGDVIADNSEIFQADGELGNVTVKNGSEFTQLGTAGDVDATKSTITLMGTVENVTATDSDVVAIADAQGDVSITNSLTGKYVTNIDSVAGTLALDNAKATVSTLVGDDTTLTNGAELTQLGGTMADVVATDSKFTQTAGTAGDVIADNSEIFQADGELGNVTAENGSEFTQLAGTVGDVVATDSTITLMGTVENVTATDSDVIAIANAQGDVVIVGSLTDEYVTNIDSVAGTLALDNASATVSTLVGGDTTLTNGSGLTQLGGEMQDINATDSNFTQMDGVAGDVVADNSQIFQADGELGDVVVKNGSEFTQLAGTAGDVVATDSTISLLGTVENVTTTDSDVLAIADAQGDVSIMNSLTGEYATNIGSVAGTLALDKAAATVSTEVGGDTTLTNGADLTLAGGTMKNVTMADSTFLQDGTVGDVTATNSTYVQAAGTAGTVSLTSSTATLAGTTETLTLDASDAEISGTVTGTTTLTNDSDVTATGTLAAVIIENSAFEQTAGTIASIDAKNSYVTQITAVSGDVKIADATTRATVVGTIGGDFELDNSTAKITTGNIAGTTKLTNGSSVIVESTGTVHAVSMTGDSSVTTSGVLALNVALGEKVEFDAGTQWVLKSGTSLLLSYQPAARTFAAADSNLMDYMLAGTPVTIFEGAGTIVTSRYLSIEDFLYTDPTITALANENVVVYDRSNGLAVHVVTENELLAQVSVPSQLQGLVDALDVANRTTGLVDLDNASSIASIDDPLVKLLLTNPSAGTDAVITLSPLAYSSMIAIPQAIYGNDIRSISKRIEGRRYDKFTGTKEATLFVQAQGQNTDNDSGRNSPNFDFYTAGVLVGVDTKLDKDSVVGVALGTDFGRAKIHHSGGKIESTNIRLNVFAGQTFADYFYVNAGAHLGLGFYDVKHNTVLGDCDEDTTGINLGANIEVGCLIPILPDVGFYAMPHLNLAYLHSTVEDFEDSAFEIDRFYTNSLRGGAGVTFAWQATQAFRLTLDFSYSHEFCDDEAEIDYSYKGHALSLDAPIDAEDVYSASLGFEAQIWGNQSLYGGYTFEAGTHSEVSHGVNIGVRARF